MLLNCRTIFFGKKIFSPVLFFLNLEKIFAILSTELMYMRNYLKKNNISFLGLSIFM